MISQIQLLDVPTPHYAKGKILEHKARSRSSATQMDPVLVSLGGGVKDVEVRILDSIVGPMASPPSGGHWGRPWAPTRSPPWPRPWPPSWRS
jgi:hypothetical protein